MNESEKRERDMIEMLLAAGAVYGYGNMIARLKAEWIKKLMKKYDFTYEQAELAADTEPYKGGAQ